MEDPFIAALTLLLIPRAIVVNSLCLFVKASSKFLFGSIRNIPFGDSRAHQSVHVDISASNAIAVVSQGGSGESAKHSESFLKHQTV